MLTSNGGFPQIEFDEVETAMALVSPTPAWAERIRALRAEAEEVRSDLEALDTSIAWLRAELRTLRQLPAVAEPPPAMPGFFSALLDWRAASAFLGCFLVGLRVFA